MSLANHIDILLATYNGEKYLNTQLESILTQDYQDWKLLIHDDGSSDNTVQIIQEHVLKYPSKIIFINDGIKTGGAKNNFFHLLKYSTAAYVMFCDQDDVWLNNKINITLRKMLKTESKYPNKPVLIHTDLIVTDEQLNVIAESIFKYQKLNHYFASDLKILAIENCITGCTVMINQNLLLLIVKINPIEAIMHDWWIGLICLKHGGIIEFIPHATILYRQHHLNTIGAQRINIAYYAKKIIETKKIIERIYKQAKALGIPINISMIIFFKIKNILFKIFK